MVGLQSAGNFMTIIISYPRSPRNLAWVLQQRQVTHLLFPSRILGPHICVRPPSLSSLSVCHPYLIGTSLFVSPGYLHTVP